METGKGGNGMAQNILPLTAIEPEQTQLCGGKAAGLGRLTRLGLRVPPGFCVTAEALDEVLAANDLDAPIAALAESIDFEDFAGAEAICAEIRALIEAARIPDELDHGIREAYNGLVSPQNRYVAVRSSVAVRDSEISSFPGMMDTYHYVLGEDEVVAKVRECWASLWSARAAHVRHHRAIPHRQGIIAPVVQLMVNAETAGVMFTADPVSRDETHVVIESNWGIGESVVSGKSMNDFYVLGKRELNITQRKVARKTVMVTMDAGKGRGRHERPVPPGKSTASTLSDRQLIELAASGRRIEENFGFCVDVEWAYQGGQLYTLQARKIRYPEP